MLPRPFTSTKDIFALRAERTVNAYRKISINKLELSVSGVPLRGKVALRISPNIDTGLADIRFWYDKKFVGMQTVRNKDLNIPNF